MRKTPAAALLASTSCSMRMADPAPEAGAPALPPGVTQEGASTTFTPVEGEAPAVDPNAPKVEAAADDRPKEWPEGVNSWEDFGKLSAEDRVKALTAATPPEAAATKIETKGTETEAPKVGIDLLVAQSLEGVDPAMAPKVEPFVRTFAEKGTLTDAEVTQAAKETGFSEAMVRQFMKGGEAVAAEAVQPVFALVGGEANFAGFQAWANEALGPDDHAKINGALGLSADGLTVTGVPNATAMKDYADAYLASGRGPAPRDLTSEASTTTTPAAGEVSGYASQEEQTRAINNPKYRSDATYRKSVEDKIKLSNF